MVVGLSVAPCAEMETAAVKLSSLGMGQGGVVERGPEPRTRKTQKRVSVVATCGN